MTVTVIGWDRAAVVPGGATLVVGAQRHLDSVDTDAERIVLGPLEPALERIAEHDRSGGTVAVLASGDPGFFGIVRALRAAGIVPIVQPAVSSVATICARAGVHWDDALVVSAHGRSLKKALNVCRARPKVVVLTAPGQGPAELGAGLTGLDRTLVVGEQLGTAAERVSTLPAGSAVTRIWADPNVVLVLDPSAPMADAGWLAGASPEPGGWALPESAYAHRDSMITKAEIRAYGIARLGPRLGDLVWDVGAGSGAVAAECARFGAAVIAVERDRAALPLIAANTAGLGVQIVAGQAPAALESLPDPDAVFVGGGGREVLAACFNRRPSRIVITLAALERVSPALDALTAAGYAAEGVQLSASRLTALPDGAHRLAAINPVWILSGVLS